MAKINKCIPLQSPSLSVWQSVHISCKHYSSKTDELILMEICAVVVYHMRICIKEDNPGPNYFKVDHYLCRTKGNVLPAMFQYMVSKLRTEPVNLVTYYLPCTYTTHISLLDLYQHTVTISANHSSVYKIYSCGFRQYYLQGSS